MQVCQIIERSCLSSTVCLKCRFNWGPVISFAKLHGLKFERMLAEDQVFSNLSGSVSVSVPLSVCYHVHIMVCVLWHVCYSVYMCV